MIVAVIDDGVNTGYYPKIGSLAFDLCVCKNGRIQRRHNAGLYIPSHGTTCAAIIKKYAPSAEIGSIQVLADDTKRGDPKQLVAAINWCAEHRIPLVHMSLGSRLLKDWKLISEAVSHLLAQGSVIVSALANTMRYSAPACLDGVIGVRTNSTLRGGQFYPLDGGIFEVLFAASSLHMLTNYEGKSKETPLCNSFAAPLMTAKVHDLLNRELGISFLEIVTCLGGTVESFQERLEATAMLPIQTDIPIFSVQGNPDEAVSLTKRLCRRFSQRGYTCMGFNAYPQKIDELPSIPSFVSLQADALQTEELPAFFEEIHSAWLDRRLNRRESGINRQIIY